jgi:hypothetical protein
MRHTIVPAAERREFREQAARARAHYSRAGCNYWLFEESSLPGAYVEFFEARDAESLLRAHRESSNPATESARMYVEVDLS